MDRASFQSLLTPAGQEVLRAAVQRKPLEKDFLSHFQALERLYPREVARAALEIAILRREAVGKFPPYAHKLYFTRSALEQATPHEVARYRAERFRPYSHLIDLGCSVGGDTLVLAGIAPTLGLDLDPLRLQMASANVSALGLGHRVAFARTDLRDSLPVSSSARSIALFFDPARRSHGRRAFSVHDYQPPLEIIDTWLPRLSSLGVKVSPAVDLAELAEYDCEVEFISLNGELKEAALWFGPLKTASRRATLLPGVHTLLPDASPSADSRPGLPLSAPKSYLYEPDPAVLRAGLVAELGARLDAAQLDPDIAYLTADSCVDTPFARSWVVEDWMPFNLKRLRAYLRSRDVGHLTVKKRGSPLQPQDLIHRLRLAGESDKTLFLTHLEGDPVVVICSPYASSNHGDS